MNVAFSFSSDAFSVDDNQDLMCDPIIFNWDYTSLPSVGDELMICIDLWPGLDRIYSAITKTRFNDFSFVIEKIEWGYFTETGEFLPDIIVQVKGLSDVETLTK